MPDMNEIDIAASVYSDVYKEYHGIRPRWVTHEGESANDIWASVQRLCDDMAEQRSWDEVQTAWDEFQCARDAERDALDAEEAFQVSLVDQQNFDAWIDVVMDCIEADASRKSLKRMNRKRKH